MNMQGKKPPVNECVAQRHWGFVRRIFISYGRLHVCVCIYLVTYLYFGYWLYFLFHKVAHSNLNTTVLCCRPFQPKWPLCIPSAGIGVNCSSKEEKGMQFNMKIGNKWLMIPPWLVPRKILARVIFITILIKMYLLGQQLYITLQWKNIHFCIVISITVHLDDSYSLSRSIVWCCIQFPLKLFFKQFPVLNNELQKISYNQAKQCWWEKALYTPLFPATQFEGSNIFLLL